MKNTIQKVLISLRLKDHPLIEIQKRIEQFSCYTLADFFGQRGGYSSKRIMEIGVNYRKILLSERYSRYFAGDLSSVVPSRVLASLPRREQQKIRISALKELIKTEKL